jgi:hypothetical protein
MGRRRIAHSLKAIVYRISEVSLIGKPYFSNSLHARQ